jgi:hypothetical protein
MDPSSGLLLLYASTISLYIWLAEESFRVFRKEDFLGDELLLKKFPDIH